MKKLILSSMLCLGLLSAARAQLNTNVPTVEQTFFQSVQGYFSSLNTNLPATSTMEFWTGTATVNNDRMYAEFAGSYHPDALKGFGLDAVFRNDTALGSLAQAIGGLSYGIVTADVRLTGYLHGGYDYDLSEIFVEPGVRATKMLTANTFAGVGLGLPFYLHGQGRMTPTFSLMAGFKF